VACHLCYHGIFIFILIIYNIFQHRNTLSSRGNIGTSQTMRAFEHRVIFSLFIVVFIGPFIFYLEEIKAPKKKITAEAFEEASSEIHLPRSSKE
jgi:hypothetical protein